MTDTELKTWERECRELTDQELKLLRQLLELKQKEARHQSED